jgi:hypothetical protein
MVKKNTLTVVAVVVIVLILIIVAFAVGPRIVDSLRGGGGGGGGDDGNGTGPEPNKPPTAVLTADKYLSKEGEGVTFDGNESFDIDYTGNLTNKGIFLFEWNFGDGSDPMTTLNGTEIVYPYSDQGIYNVVLTVYDEDGASDSDNVSIRVVPQDVNINSGTQVLIGEPLVPGIRILANSTETAWNISRNAKVMNLTISVTGFYAQEVSQNRVEVLLYNPWEDILRNDTIEVMGSDSITWDFLESEISVPGEYYVFVQCTKGAAFVTVEGTVSYL